MSKINGIGIGVSYGNSSGSGSLIDSSTFFAPLKTSLILTRGTGGPTWSRATKAWGFNELGYLRELPSGCAFFGGARLVRNTVRTTSEDFSNAVWVKTAVTVSGTNTVVCTNATNDQYISQTLASPIVVGQVMCLAVRVRRVSGGAEFIQITGKASGFGTGQWCNFSLLNGSFSATGCTASSVLVAGTSDTYDFSIRVPATSTSSSADQYIVAFSNSISDTRSQSFIGDGVKSFELLRAWSVDVTNYDASYIPEYVSVGVEASPYFGAGIDGAKYYETDWQGAPIAAANLLGFRREASAINNLPHSRDLSNAAWSTKTNITAAKTATGLDGIANTATTLTATAADAIILQPITLASAARCASAYVKRKTGTGTISFTQDGGSTWTDITSQINSSTWSRVEITSTLANPSVGFKISTSGDAIDVDCVQNEAGAVATSPIVTTTTTVSRNADSLTYQTASNWSDAAGAAYAYVAPYVFTGTAAGFGANGLTVATTNSGVKGYDGTNTANGPVGSPGTLEKIAISWGGGSMTAASSGAVGASSSYDGAFGLTNITIGTNGFIGYIGPVAIWNYQMTDAQLQAITS